MEPQLCTTHDFTTHTPTDDRASKKEASSHRKIVAGWSENSRNNNYTENIKLWTASQSCPLLYIPCKTHVLKKKHRNVHLTVFRQIIPWAGGGSIMILSANGIRALHITEKKNMNTAMNQNMYHVSLCVLQCTRTWTRRIKFHQPSNWICGKD